MNDFTYHNPTKIEFGKAKEKNIGLYIKESNIKKVLLVYGTGSIKKNGLYENVIDSLNEHDMDKLQANHLAQKSRFIKEKITGQHRNMLAFLASRSAQPMS